MRPCYDGDLSIGLYLEIYVVTLASTGHMPAALAFGFGAALIFLGLWLVFPLIGRRYRE